MRRLFLVGLLLLATVVWGSTFVLIKRAVAQYDFVGFLALRFAIGSAALAALSIRRLRWRSLLLGGTIGLVLAAAYFLETWGLCYTTATNSGLIVGLFIVFTPLASRWLFGVKIRPAFWAAVAVSLAGLWLLTGAGYAPLNRGDLLSLGTAVFCALQIALLDRYAKGHDSLSLALAQNAAVAAVALAAWPLAGHVCWPNREVWTILAFTGLLATAAAYWVQTFVQQRLPGGMVAIVLAMQPVFSVLFAAWFAGERLSGTQIVGMLLMIGAIVAAQVVTGDRLADARHSRAGRA